MPKQIYGDELILEDSVTAAKTLAELADKSHASLTGVTADQHHAQAHTLASHSTKAHSELTGVGASDHHAKTTSFADITDRAGMARMPDGTSGYVLTAKGAGIDPAYEAGGGGGGATAIYKTADESVTNSTTLQNDDHLLFAMGANEKWQVNILLLPQSASDTPDCKAALSLPTGAVYYGNKACINTAATGNLCERWEGASTAFCASAAIRSYFTAYNGVVINGANAGNFQLQWAQNTANATATTIKAGSFIIAHKLA